MHELVWFWGHEPPGILARDQPAPRFGARDGLARSVGRRVHTVDAFRRAGRKRPAAEPEPVAERADGFPDRVRRGTGDRLDRRARAFVRGPRVGPGSRGSRAGNGLRPGKRIDHRARRGAAGRLDAASARTFLARGGAFGAVRDRGARAAALSAGGPDAAPEVPMSREE